MKPLAHFTALVVALAAGGLVTLTALRADDVPVPTADAPAAPAPAPAAAAPAETAPAAAEVAPPADSGELDIAAMMAPRVLGNPDAKVTIHEYASLTCPHCAHFSKTVLPELKKQYIDTGKVKLVYHDFPLNPEAVTAAMLARCAPQDQYFSLIESFFDTQESWSHSENMVNLLKSATRMAGLSDEKADKCLASDAFRNAILQARIDAESNAKIDATPTLIINDNVDGRLTGIETIDQLKGPIDAALTAAGVSP